MTKPYLLLGSLTGIFFLLALSACGSAQSGARGKRVIVLGIDGMDPSFLERHWDSLPNLSKLRREGDFKRLATTIPPQSPVAWSTFITGMDPGSHGIYDFIHRNPETLLPFSSMAEVEPPARTLTIGPYLLPLSKGNVRTHRKGRAFWQILSEQGIPVTVLRMPTNFPPVECEGESLSGMGTPDMLGTFSTFTFFTDDPKETSRQVPGGRITSVRPVNHRYTLPIPGPANTLRKDRRETSVNLIVDVDPANSAARFELGDTRFILSQGEWSEWIKVRFPLIPGLMSASGMLRVYAKQLRPGFRVYVSPINIDPAEPELPIATPESYSRELAAAIGPFYTQGMPEDTAALRQGVFTRPEYEAQSRLVSEEHLRLLRHAVRQFREGFLFFHFFGVDQDSHMLWGRYEPQLLETYRLVDQAIGDVMEQAGDATLIVMSDHGFTSFDRSVNLNSWLWKEGFLALDDPANAGADELFEHVDWSKTQAYALGLNGLYLNLLGREEHGSVAPGIESEEVTKKLIERLKDFRDPASGRSVVETVYVSSEVYQGRNLDSAPDLLVGYGPGYRSSWQTALGAVPKAVVEDNTEEWIGDHCIAANHVPGVLLGNRKSQVSDPRLADLTAAILSEFGISPAEGMTGRPIYGKEALSLSQR